MAQASVGAVFDAARRSGVGFRAVQAPGDLADLEIPPDALARLSASLRAGMVAIVPERPVEINAPALNKPAPSDAVTSTGPIATR